MVETIRTRNRRQRRAKSTEPVVEYLTAAEVAARIGVSVQALANWRARDIGPLSIKIMGSVRYPRKEFDQWESRQNETTARGERA
jgi:predicted DNA-binding transcriptional regulator AlpA